MSCLCGDIACPSCGPAQGFDPQAEAMAEAIVTALPQGLVDVLEEAQWEDEDGDAYDHIVALVEKSRQDALQGVIAMIDRLMAQKSEGIVTVEHEPMARSMGGEGVCMRLWENIEGQPHPNRTEEEVREWGW
jgi:hypothetical protein